MATITQAQSGTRSLPISQSLATVLENAARVAGVDVRVFSGGQPPKGQGARVGSTRHDHGNAVDIYLYQNGQQLQFTNQQHLPIIQTFIQTAVANGANGIGAGTDYMGPAGLHVGFGPDGKPGGPVTVWGAGGKSRNAPGWLRASVEGIASPRSVPDTVQMASAPLPRLRPDTAAAPIVKSNATKALGGLAPSAVAAANPLPPERNTLTAGDRNISAPMTLYPGGVLGAMPAQFRRDDKIPDTPARAPVQPAMAAADYGPFLDNLKAGTVPYEQLPASWRAEMAQKVGGDFAAQQAYDRARGVPATLSAYAPPQQPLDAAPFDAVMGTNSPPLPRLRASVVPVASGPTPPLPVGSRYSETNYVSTAPRLNPWNVSVPSGVGQPLVTAALNNNAKATGAAGDKLLGDIAGFMGIGSEGRKNEAVKYFTGLNPLLQQRAADNLYRNPSLGQSLPAAHGFRDTITGALKQQYPSPIDYTSIYRQTTGKPAPATASKPVQVASIGNVPMPTLRPSAPATQPVVVKAPAPVTSPAKPKPKTTEPIGIGAGFSAPAVPAKTVPVVAATPPSTFDYSSFYKSNAGASLGTAAKTDGVKKQQPVKTAITVAPVVRAAPKPVAPPAPALRPQQQNIIGATTLPGLGGVQSRVGGVLGGLSNAYTAMGGKADPIVSTYQARNLPSNVTSHTTQNTQGGSQYRTYTTNTGKTITTFSDAQGNNYAVAGR